MGWFADVYCLYSDTVELFGREAGGGGSGSSHSDEKTSAAAAAEAEAEAGGSSQATTPTKPSSGVVPPRLAYTRSRRAITHILHTWERTALHQYADFEVREELVRDLRRLYEHLDRLFFAEMLWFKSDGAHRDGPRERVRLDIFDEMPSPWCGGMRRYLGVRRHAFASGGGDCRRCRGLARGGGVNGHGHGGNGNGNGSGEKVGGGGGGGGRSRRRRRVETYEEHPGATVWTTLLCRSAKSLRRRRRLRIALVLRSPGGGDGQGAYYSIEHLFRVLVHEMCHAYIEKMWEPAWPAADAEAFARRHGGGGGGGGYHDHDDGDHDHGVLWQALCWKMFEEIESWGIESAQGLRRQDPMLDDLVLHRTRQKRMPEATMALFRSLGPGLV